MLAPANQILPIRHVGGGKQCPVISSIWLSSVALPKLASKQMTVLWTAIKHKTTNTSTYGGTNVCMALEAPTAAAARYGRQRHMYAHWIPAIIIIIIVAWQKFQFFTELDHKIKNTFLLQIVASGGAKKKKGK